MRAHQPAFYSGVAQVLAGEDAKARTYVRHGTSLGTLREKMVAKFIRDETPGRFEIGTGFVCVPRAGDPPKALSRQCDLLVHDSSNYAPLYRWEDFVVVEAEAAQAAIEVKTKIDTEALREIAAIEDQLIEVRGGKARPYSFAFGLTGISFSAFAASISDLVDTTPADEFKMGCGLRQLPACIAVDEQNYFCIRTQSSESGEQLLLMIDFSTYPGISTTGFATGMFLVFYRELLENKAEFLTDKALVGYFNWLQCKDAGKRWITGKGQTGGGAVPASVASFE